MMLIQDFTGIIDSDRNIPLSIKIQAVGVDADYSTGVVNQGTAGVSVYG